MTKTEQARLASETAKTLRVLSDKEAVAFVRAGLDALKPKQN